MGKTIKAYKGFNPDMTCNPDGVPFQYEEGNEYENENGASACKYGFHACENPLDTLRYYSPDKSIYHEVELSGEIDKSEYDKTCASKIKIGAKIDIAGIVKAGIEFVKENCTGSLTSGYRANAATSGYGANAATSGRGSVAVCSGYKGSAAANNPTSIAVAWGFKSKAKGVKGTFLVFADWDGNKERYWDFDELKFKGAKMAQVDGSLIKEDTWYCVENGKVKEVIEDEN